MTGWSPRCWVDYAHRFYASFERYWHKGIKLIAFGEDGRPPGPRVEMHALAEIPGCIEWLRANDTARARGGDPHPTWKDKERAAGYSYRWDAWKFCRQGFIPWAAAHLADTTHLLWLDADVETLQPMEAGMIEALLPPDQLVAYLGREGKHSEIGFQLYRIRDNEGRPIQRTFEMLRLFSETYRSGAVFELAEWHSAYVFDHCRRIWMEEPFGYAQNLTPGRHGHVFKDHPLIGRWMRHDKGDRKYRGQR